jgi:hypothetical protein
MTSPAWGQAVAIEGRPPDPERHPADPPVLIRLPSGTSAPIGGDGPPRGGKSRLVALPAVVERDAVLAALHVFPPYPIAPDPGLEVTRDGG